MSDLAFVLTHSPQSHSLARDALDAVMTALLFDQEVELFLLGDGAFHLSDAESQSRLGTLLELGALTLLAGTEDVAQRKLQAEAERLRVGLFTRKELGRYLAAQHKILSF